MKSLIIFECIGRDNNYMNGTILPDKILSAEMDGEWTTQVLLYNYVSKNTTEVVA